MRQRCRAAMATSKRPFPTRIGLLVAHSQGAIQGWLHRNIAAQPWAALVRRTRAGGRLALLYFKGIYSVNGRGPEEFFLG